MISESAQHITSHTKSSHRSMWHIWVSSMLHVTCFMLLVTCHMLHVTLNVTCHMLHVTCYILHVTCYMLHAYCILCDSVSQEIHPSPQLKTFTEALFQLSYNYWHSSKTTCRTILFGAEENHGACGSKGELNQLLCCMFNVHEIPWIASLHRWWCWFSWACYSFSLASFRFSSKVSFRRSYQKWWRGS